MLFFSDNGHGLGHITRLLAVATRAGEHFQPIFLTMSEAHHIATNYGFPTEYFPSSSKLGITKDLWQGLLHERLRSMIQRHDIQAVVVDHVAPSTLFASIIDAVGPVHFFWSRRGLWRRGANRRALRLRHSFDHIVEPFDVASPLDRGLTAVDRDGVHIVDPVLLVEPDERVSRAEARDELGLPPEGRSILIQLSDSDTRKLEDMTRRAVRTVRSAVGDETVSMFVPEHPLHHALAEGLDAVTTAPVYPIGRYLDAFDAAISTAGYNSFHEIVGSGLPALFVARDEPSVDDQARRAQYAAMVGRAATVGSVWSHGFARAVERMLTPLESTIASELARELMRFGGAEQFADLITGLVIDSDPPQRSADPSIRLDRKIETALDEFVSGPPLPAGTSSRTDRYLVIATEHTADECAQLVQEVEAQQRRRRDFRPIFLTASHDCPQLRRSGFQFETVMDESQFDELGSGSSYGEYVRQRVAELRRLYEPARTIAPAPGVPLENA